MNSALHRLGESQATNCDFMRWFGHVNYLNFAVTKIPMARGVMNMASYIARSGDWSACISMEEKLLTQAMELTNKIANAKRITLQAREPLQTLWTGASTIGIGAVYEEAQETQMTYEPRHIPANRIFLGELLAGLTEAMQFKKLLTRAYAWAVDNTAAARTLKKGHSCSAGGDQILCEWIRRAPLPCNIIIVPTACQRADVHISIHLLSSDGDVLRQFMPLFRQQLKTVAREKSRLIKAFYNQFCLSVHRIVGGRKSSTKMSAPRVATTKDALLQVMLEFVMVRAVTPESPKSCSRGACSTVRLHKKHHHINKHHHQAARTMRGTF